MNVANSGSVEVEIDGEVHKATYIIWKDVVTITYKGKEKSTQVGGLTPENVAGALLHEMVRNI
jgi:hypothetical protein